MELYKYDKFYRNSTSEIKSIYSFDREHYLFILNDYYFRVDIIVIKCLKFY